MYFELRGDRAVIITIDIFFLSLITVEQSRGSTDGWMGATRCFRRFITEGDRSAY